MFSKFFIERPIFATVVSLIICIAGLVSMKLLPIAQYPTITPVQVQVTTTYPGADAKTVGDSVAAPIEAQINGVDNFMYMTSTSSSTRSEEHTSELQSRFDLVCRLLLEKKIFAAASSVRSMDAALVS